MQHPFGDSVRLEAIRANELDPISFGHVELIFYRGHHLAPVVWLMLLLPKHRAFLEKIQGEIYKELKQKKSSKAR